MGLKLGVALLELLRQRVTVPEAEAQVLPVGLPLEDLLPVRVVELAWQLFGHAVPEPVREPGCAQGRAKLGMKDKGLWEESRTSERPQLLQFKQLRLKNNSATRGIGWGMLLGPAEGGRGDALLGIPHNNSL